MGLEGPNCARLTEVIHRRSTYGYASPLPFPFTTAMVSASTLLGVVLLARHGDRLEFFQDPFTYNPAQTFLTPLGSVRIALCLSPSLAYDC